MCHYLDKGDTVSTGNMRWHIKKCWGAEAYNAAKQVSGSANATRDAITTYRRCPALKLNKDRQKGEKGKISKEAKRIRLRIV